MVISSFPKCDIVKLSLHSVDDVENLLLQMKIFWVNQHPILIQIVIKFKWKFVSLNVLWSIDHQNVLQLTTVSNAANGLWGVTVYILSLNTWFWYQCCKELPYCQIQEQNKIY